MATKRLTGATIQTFKIDNSTITYDGTKQGGSDHALGNFSVHSSDGDTVALVGDGETITGELLEVERDQYCSVMVAGQGVQGKMGAANGASAGDKLVGATGDAVRGQTGGYVKAAGTDADGRGLVTDTSGSAKNDTVSYNV